MPWWRRPGVLLAAVALVHAALPLVLLGRHWFIGIDESVYLSQINAHVPPGGFSAPRARGSTFLAAPITVFTDSIPAMRIWTSLLSGAALYLGFRPWLRLRPGYVVPLAAAMVASLWVVTYYGFETMPNEWLAFAVVGACGCLLRYLFDGRWVSLAGVGLAMAAAALLRPSDAVFAAVALGLVCLFTRVAWRRRVVGIGMLAAGTFVGVAEWVVEAYTSYGGLSARLHAAEAEQGGSGLYFSLGKQARVLAGPALCRGACHADAALPYRLWWVAAAILVLVAVATIRRRRAVLDLAPLVLGLVMAAQYVFTVNYAAPRFLIPTYAALALPVATGLVVVVESVRRPSARWALAGVLVLGFAAHLVLQMHVITSHFKPAGERGARATYASVTRLHHAGVASDCLVIGEPGLNGPLAYVLRCSNRNPGRVGLYTDLHAAEPAQVVWLRNTAPPRLYGVRWRRVHLQGMPTRYAYVSLTGRPVRT